MSKKPKKNTGFGNTTLILRPNSQAKCSKLLKDPWPFLKSEDEYGKSFPGDKEVS